QLSTQFELEGFLFQNFMAINLKVFFSRTLYAGRHHYFDGGAEGTSKTGALLCTNQTGVPKAQARRKVTHRRSSVVISIN
ncbi:unnamed protein product, partial [Amoebophrya sp. A120]